MRQHFAGAEQPEWMADLIDEGHRLCAENAKLRADLEWIADRCRQVRLGGAGGNVLGDIEDIQMRAERRLGQS